MHHAGSGAGEASHLPQGGVPADAGLLAERAPAEDGDQGHPQPPAGPRQEPAGVPGYPGLRELRGWRDGGVDLRPRSFNSIRLIRGLKVCQSLPAAAFPASMLDPPPYPSPALTLLTAPSFSGNLSNVYRSVKCLSEAGSA